jgi:dTDP-4-amino-4,6-dideoxygalactose transaminase
MAAFSFYPTKNLGALGDAGIVVTDNPDYSQRAKLLREYGWKNRYISEISGWNTRLDEIQAAVLRVKLRHLGEDNSRRRKLANIYLATLAGSCLILPQSANYAMHCYHQFVIRCQNRPALQEHLKNNGIGTLVHYPVPVHMQPAYIGKYRTAGTLKNTERAAAEILSLPLYPEMTEEQINTVIKTILSFIENNPRTL